MTGIIDPVELLNSLAPPAGWDERTDLATDERAAAIHRRVVTGNVVPFRAPRRRLRIVTGIVVTAALGGAGVAALLQRGADEDRVLACWSEAVSPPTAQVERAWDGVADPVEACAPPWQDGTFGTQGPAAPLRACVTANGVVAIVPGDDDTCADLGMPAYAAPEPGDASVGDQDFDANALQRMLEKKYHRGGCYTEQQALEGVSATLEEFMFDGWVTRSLGSFESEETCASISIERETKTVLIVGVPRSPEVPN